MGQPVAYVPPDVRQPGNDQPWMTWLPAALFIPVPIPATGSGPWHLYLPGLTHSLPCRHPCADGRFRARSLLHSARGCAVLMLALPSDYAGQWRPLPGESALHGESGLGGWRGFNRWPGCGIRAKGAEWGTKGIMKNIKVYRLRPDGPLKRGAGISRIYQDGLSADAQQYVFNLFLLIDVAGRKKFTHVFIP